MSKTSCANCGAELPGPGSVCPACERELSAMPSSSGRHACPACQGRFNRPAISWLPEPVPWYKPQAPMPQCPHCKAILRDRLAVGSGSGEWAAVLLLMLAYPFIARLGWPVYVVWTVLAALLVRHFRRWLALKKSLPVGAERYALYQKT